MHDHKLKAGCFRYKQLYNSFTQNLWLGVQFESSGDESDTKYYITTNTNSKEAVNYLNEKAANPDVETVDIPGDVAPQVFSYDSYKEDVRSKFFFMSAPTEGEV